MKLQFKNLDRRGRNAIFSGARVSLRFPVGAFVDKKAPASIEVTGLAAPLTAEERKAARAAITPAEKLARMERRVAAMKAALAATAPAPTADKKKGGKR